jgi:hypothetical protein
MRRPVKKLQTNVRQKMRARTLKGYAILTAPVRDENLLRQLLLSEETKTT